MDLILSNSSLKLVDGENCSQATKSEQKANQKAFCDDDAKKSTGKKIDLIVSDKRCELSSSEWNNKQLPPLLMNNNMSKISERMYLC